MNTQIRQPLLDFLKALESKFPLAIFGYIYEEFGDMHIIYYNDIAFKKQIHFLKLWELAETYLCEVDIYNFIFLDWSLAGESDNILKFQNLAIEEKIENEALIVKSRLNVFNPINMMEAGKDSFFEDMENQIELSKTFFTSKPSIEDRFKSSLTSTLDKFKLKKPLAQTDSFYVLQTCKENIA